MRAGRFGSKAGRVAVVVAFVLGTLVAGTTAAGATDRLSTGDKSAALIGQTVARAFEVDWS
jgi:hypothetical protein